MQSWQKNRNFKKYKNTDGSYTYIITIDGEKVEVVEEIYIVYAQAGYKMEYMEHDIKCDRFQKDKKRGKLVRYKNGLPKMLPEREVSLEKLMDEDWDFPSSEQSPEESVIGRFEIKALQDCLDSLDPDERGLIAALFFDGRTERDYAKMLNLSKTVIHARKVKILAKLKNLMNS